MKASRNSQACLRRAERPIAQRGKGQEERVLQSIYVKTLSFFSAFRALSIDFGQFVPMFRLDAARYRSAIS
jgi:hypothetical protein